MTPAQNTTAYIQGFEDGRRAAKAEFAKLLAEQEQEQEPVAWMQNSIELYVKDFPDKYHTIPLYTHPPLPTPQPQEPEQESVAFDVKCDACKGNGLDATDNNYFCSVCAGSGFVEKMFYADSPQRKPLTDWIDPNEADHAELRAQDQADKRRFWQSIKHPDCRDPDHAGCEHCEETEEEA